MDPFVEQGSFGRFRPLLLLVHCDSAAAEGTEVSMPEDKDSGEPVQLNDNISKLLTGR